MSTDSNLEAVIASAVEKALGGESKPAAPSTQTSPTAPASRTERLMETFLEMTLAEKVSAYKSPGSASGAPVPERGYDESDPSSLVRASADDVKALQKAGKFRQAADSFRNSLGGNSAAFPLARPRGPGAK